MTTLAHQCPHCLKEHMTLRIVGQSYGRQRPSGEHVSYVHMYCPHCGMPCAAELESTPPGFQLPPIDRNSADLAALGWNVVAIWPEPPRPRMPEHLPEAVARAFQAAERNFPHEGMEEASAGSYGRALDVGTKLFAPDLGKHNLAARIGKLAETGRITPELASWAHAIRSIRNDALHDVETMERDELVAIRGFSEMVLTYLFTLPGMLKARQAITDEKPNG